MGGWGAQRPFGVAMSSERRVCAVHGRSRAAKPTTRNEIRTRNPGFTYICEVLIAFLFCNPISKLESPLKTWMFSPNYFSGFFSAS